MLSCSFLFLFLFKYLLFLFCVYSIFAYLLISVFKTTGKILEAKETAPCASSFCRALLFAPVCPGFFLSCWKPSLSLWCPLAVYSS